MTYFSCVTNVCFYRSVFYDGLAAGRVTHPPCFIYRCIPQFDAHWTRSKSWRTSRVVMTNSSSFLCSIPWSSFTIDIGKPGRKEIDHRKHIFVHRSKFDLAGNWDASFSLATNKHLVSSSSHQSSPHQASLDAPLLTFVSCEHPRRFALRCWFHCMPGSCIHRSR